MKHKVKISTVILIIGCLIGLCLLLYPSFSNYWNNTFATHVITDYKTHIENISKKDYSRYWKQATEYNEALTKRDYQFALPEEMQEEYRKCLNVENNELMGYIEISRLKLELPIYHGTENAVLQSAIGHLDWSSLPTGGASTHCVLSGHRGLMNAKLFSDLDMLREGDIFVLYILNETLVYEVDRIRTVEPDDTSELAVVEGKDYCTLLTCTPYGINTHRLLVRGHRVDSKVIGASVISEAVVVDQLIVAVFLAIPVLFILLMAVMLKTPEKKKDNTNNINTPAEQGETDIPDMAEDFESSENKEEHR